LTERKPARKAPAETIKSAARSASASATKNTAKSATNAAAKTAAPADDAPEKDRQFVTALARGLDVLRCFTRATPALGTADIARMTGLAQPTVWRLCYTLIQEGYLVQTDRGGRLRPGISVLGLGQSAIGSMPIAELARDDMQTLASRYQCAVSLGMRDGHYMVYMQRMQGSQIILRDLEVGSRVPLSSSATGWAYLAGLPDDERDKVFKELQEIEKKRWPTLLPKIKQSIAQYKRTGYIVNKGSLHEQINAVAVPILSSDGNVLLSLSAGGISLVFDDDTLVKVGQELKRLAVRFASALDTMK
jgi:DNA-binding IclR family transcriptional regulator